MKLGVITTISKIINIFKERMFLVMILAVICFLVARWALPVAQSKGMYSKAHMAMKVLWVSQGDIVIGGDSRAEIDVSPQMMKQELGEKRILNFAFSGTGYSHSYLSALEKVVDLSGGQPTIILEANPYLFTQKAMTFNTFEQAKENVVSSKRMFALNFESFMRWTLPMPILPYLRQKLLNDIVIPEWSFERFEDGYVAANLVPPNPTRLFNDQYFALKYHDNIIDDEIVNRVLRTIKQWQQKGITVYMFRAPLLNEILLQEDRLSTLAQQPWKDKFIQAGINWLEIPNHLFENQTYDGQHLNPDAACQYSLLLAQKMVAQIN